MRGSLHQNTSGSAIRRFEKTTIHIAPHASATVGLGTYLSTEKEPEFRMSMEPNMRDMMGTAHERLDIPGSRRYLLLYHFQNFGDKACRIVVRRSSGAARDT
ncbi:MAG TPA: hypothetical protein VGS08_06250 [Candidatus Saccharimonadales bacterium]|nr:hypothetical protein [Candidatus Saccharimonadales bacterium]